MRKGSLADVLWLIFVLLFSLIVMTMQMSFSSNATIDAYAQNIVNEEVTAFTNKITGYSGISEKCNMYNTNGKRRDYGFASDTPSDGLSATANAYVNFYKNELVKNIDAKFNKNSTLKSKVVPGSLKMDIGTTIKSDTTFVSVDVKYSVNIGSYGYQNNTNGPLSKKTLSIPQKISVVRSIENPVVFANRSES